MKSKFKAILDFDFKKLNFERSSGYSGYRYGKTGQWFYEDDILKLRSLKKDFEDKFKLLYDFRSKSLPFGEYPDCVLIEFLEEIASKIELPIYWDWAKE